ncbi:MAG: universal stress protein [Ktedonobacteraceae bacterium]|nr:universal stress protein [Ktedonobacteraceae bacterium]
MDQPVAHKSFLVPLDGSHLAEAVLPATASLASSSHALVTLLHVIELRAPATIHGERHLRNATEASAYLESVASRLRAGGVTVECHVHEDGEYNVAQCIFEHTQELKCDLVIMCTHGNSGLRGLLFGSIAQQILQRGASSILLVFPHEGRSVMPFELQRILVPLDGVVAHEPALPAAMELAGAFQATLHLALVIPTLATLSGGQAVSGMLLPTTTRAVLDQAQQEAREYLDQILIQCHSEGVSATAEILRGDAAPMVLRLAERLNIDLIVMASHGRAGLDALLAGSVAARIAGRMERALLLMRAEPLEAQR